MKTAWLQSGLGVSILGPYSLFPAQQSEQSFENVNQSMCVLYRRPYSLYFHIIGFFDILWISFYACQNTILQRVPQASPDCQISLRPKKG